MIDIDLNLLRSFDILYDASALIFDRNGLRVATVGLDDNILFKTVTIARDLGRDISKLESGISLDDRIITARREIAQARSSSEFVRSLRRCPHERTP
jgi:membrane fusion protein (multidrug efflux system)